MSGGIGARTSSIREAANREVDTDARAGLVMTLGMMGDDSAASKA